MNRDIDSIDYGFFFSRLTYPACVLKPVVDERDSLADFCFAHTNEAFDNRHRSHPGESSIFALLRQVGVGGTGFLRALSGMRTGEMKSLSIEITGSALRFECDVTRSATGNFLLMARGAESGEWPVPIRNERVIMPLDAGHASGAALSVGKTRCAGCAMDGDRKPLRDRMSQPIDRKLFGKFFEANADIPTLDELLSTLCRYGAVCRYAEGEHFLESGAVQTTAGFVLRGLFRQYRVSPEGQEHTLSFYRAGTIIGSSSDYRLQKRSGATFEARTDCLVFCVDMSILARLAREDHRWYRLFYYNMSAKHVLQNEQNYSLRCENAVTRYRRFLASYRDVIPFVRSYHIASFLGITSETLSRVRKSLPESEKPTG